MDLRAETSVIKDGTRQEFVLSDIAGRDEIRIAFELTPFRTEDPLPARQGRPSSCLSRAIPRIDLNPAEPTAVLG
jgi:hypothetical protein